MKLRFFALAIVCAGTVASALPAAAQWRYYDGYRSYPPDAQGGFPPFPGQDESDQPQPEPPQAQQPQQAQPPSSYGTGYGSSDVDTTPGSGGPPPRQLGGQTYGGVADDSQAAASPKTAEVVANPTSEPPGTIVVDTRSRHLYFIQKDGSAIKYGIGVGREGFAWKGIATVGRKTEWPRWFPPKEMLERRPDLPTEMDGGLGNPLGARALYLFEGKKDTLFRIHGTNEPDTIGKAVSSGCIRMMNADVMDLYQRVPIGTRVVVL